jgi:hypothetical protein
MKKKKAKIVLAMAIIVLSTILSSCISMPYTPSIDYRIGTKGLEMTLDGPSKIEIYEGETGIKEEFSLKVENKGSVTVENDEMYTLITLPDTFLKATNPPIMTLEDVSSYNGQVGVEEINGKTRYDKDGESISHYFTLEANPPKNQGATATIKAELCYKYKTVLSTSVCINTVKQEKGKGCKISTYSFSNGQGAPIRINSVEVRELRNDDGTTTQKIVMDIDNVNGNIFSLPDGDSFKEGCLAKEKINSFNIERALLGTISLNCNKGNKAVSMKDNERQLECDVPSSLQSNAVGFLDTTLYIELGYGYYDSIEKTVDIIRKNYEE